MKSDDGIIVATAAQLRAIVRDAVADAFAKATARDAPHEVLTLEQVAELIGVHHRTVPRLVRNKGLPTLRRIGKLWRFKRADVMAWLARSKGT
jgi:excisionase family DNA binding protein